MQYFRIRCQLRAPRLLERLDVEETDSAEMLDHGVAVEFSFPEQIRLIPANVIRPQLVGRTVEVTRELVDDMPPDLSRNGAFALLRFYVYSPFVTFVYVSLLFH